MANIITSVENFVTTHQKGIRTTLAVVGGACVIATPFLTVKAKDSVDEAICKAEAELGRPLTKQEKMDVIRKNPYVWGATATTIGSLGAGFGLYGISEKVISMGNKTIEDIAEKYQTTQEAISELPEKDKEKVEKKVAEKAFTRASNRGSESPNGTEGIPVDTGYGNTLFYDVWTNTWFLSSYDKVSSVINSINEEINFGTLKSLHEYCIKQGIPTRGIDKNFFFTKGIIKLVKDGDHFYKMSDRGNPVGVLEFTSDSAPEYISEEKQRGLPFL